MRIRIEAGNGFASRFKVWDDETGRKIGLVQSVTLNVSTKDSTFQFTRFDPAEYAEKGSKATPILSPVLKGKYHPDIYTAGADFVFED